MSISSIIISSKLSNNSLEKFVRAATGCFWINSINRSTTESQENILLFLFLFTLANLFTIYVFTKVDGKSIVVDVGMALLSSFMFGNGD